MAVPHTPEWDAEDKGPSSLVIIISVTVLSTLFAAARIFVRGKIRGKLQLDDYLIMASVACSWVNVGTAIVAVLYGNGRHFETLSLEQQQKAIFWTTVGFPAGVMSFCLPKVAVVALLTRILNPTLWHRNLLWTMALLTLLSLMITMTCLFIQCQPTQSMWDFSIKGKCWDKWVLVNISIYTGCLAAFVDAYLAVYPAIVLAKLQMSIRKKVALSVALGIGSMWDTTRWFCFDERSSVVAIYKCTRLPGLASPDFLYDTSDLVIWTIVEGGTIVIAACIPTLQPLGDLLFGKRTFSSGGRRNIQNPDPGPGGGVRSEGIDPPSRDRRKKAPGQDNIISLTKITTTTVATGGSKERTLDKSQSSGRIVRTDVFSVSVENERT